MSQTEFILRYFSENQTLYLVIFILLYLILYTLVYKRYIRFFPTDQLFLHSIYSVSGVALVFFMNQLNLVPTKHFIYFLISQVCFLIGFVIFRPYKGPNSNPISFNKSPLINITFYCSLFLFLFATAITYYFQGIPIFLENRLITYQAGGGIGIFGRLINVMFPILTYSVVYRIFAADSKKQRFCFVHFFSILVLVVSGVLSGSKGAVINLVFVFSYFIIFFFTDYSTPKSALKILYSFLIIGFISALVVLIIPVLAYNGNKLLIFETLYRRIAISGDIYVLAYPNNVIDKIPVVNNGFIPLFKDFLGFTRLLSPNEIPEPLGKILYEYANNTTLIAGGANSRHNIIGYKYFGYIGGLLFSFLIGFSTSFLRNKLPKLIKKTPLGGLIFTVLALIAINLEIDPVYYIGQFNNILFIFFPFLILVYLINLRYAKKNSDYSTQLQQP